MLSFWENGGEESLLEEKSQELKIKDELIAEKEKFLQDNSDKVASLQNEISVLQVIDILNSAL